MKLEKYNHKQDVETVIPPKINWDSSVIDKINSIVKQADEMKIGIRFIIIGQKQYDLMLEESIHQPVIFKKVTIRVSPQLDGIIAYPREVGCNKEFIIG